MGKAASIATLASWVLYAHIGQLWRSVHLGPNCPLANRPERNGELRCSCVAAVTRKPPAGMPKAHGNVTVLRNLIMDLLLVVILFLLLFGGGGGMYGGLGTGWGLGPIGLIVVAVVISYLLFGYRGRR